MLTFKDHPQFPEHRRQSKTFEPAFTIGRGGVRQMHFTPDEQLLVIGGRGIDVYDPATMNLADRMLADEHIEWFQPIGDARWVLHCRQGEDRIAKFWEFGSSEATEVVRFQRRGLCNIAAARDRVVIPTGTGIDVYDEHSAKIASFELTEEEREKHQLGDVAITDDGEIAIGCVSRRILVAWDIDSGERLLEFKSWDAPSGARTRGRQLIWDNWGEIKIYELDQPDKDPVWERGDGRIIFSNGKEKAIRLGRFADYETLDWETMTFGEKVEGLEHHYGSMPVEGIGAVSENFVVALASSYGAVVVYPSDSTEPIRYDGFLVDPDSFSVSSNGKRLVVASEYGNGRAYLVDRDNAACKTVSHVDGMIAPGLSDDGETVIIPTGNNLKPRAVFTAPFDGGSDPVAGPKLMPFVHKTESFGTFYASNAYNLKDNGFIGIYNVGKSRAVMKLKEGQARYFDVSADGTRLLAAWKSELALHDLTSKAAKLQTWDVRPSAVAVGPNDWIAFVAREDDVTRLKILCGETFEHDIPFSYAGAPQLKFSRDGTELFLGSVDGTLKVYSTESGECLRSTPVFAGPFVQMTFSDEHLWALGKDGFIHALSVGGTSTSTSIDLGEAEIEMAPTDAWKPPKGLKTTPPKNPDATSVEPFPTDWAKTQFNHFVSNLAASGFVRNEFSAHAAIAMDLYAPDIGIAVVDIDEEHGCANVSFHRWDGTKDGAGVMKLGDVDPAFYSFVFKAVRDAYSED